MGSLNFYSQLQRAVEKAHAKMDGMPAQQWLQWLESNASKLAVKKDEIEWSGIKEYLALQGRQRLFRQDLGAFLRENGVRVSEVVYAGVRKRTATVGNKSEEVGTTAGPVRYLDYALPGGKNYREVLITLPAPAQAIERFQVMGQGPWVPLRDMETGFTVASGTYGEMNREAAKRNAAASGLPDPHKSNHWDVNNVLAHLRVDDRVDDAGKRVLFIQEIQSDWAQEGRSQGFQADKRKPRLVIQEVNAGFEVFNESLGRTAQDEDGNDAIFRDRGDAQAMLEQLMKDPYEQASAVPRGPFVGATADWVGLALKRAIVMAVEGGYDRVALISGGQAADLYKLSSRVSSVTVGSMKDGSWAVSQRMLDGGAPVEHKGLKSMEDVASLVGKDLADRVKKLKSGEFRQFTDVDMKVGGEGMHAFYDRIVPQVANDLLRRLGGTSVQSVRVNSTTPDKKVDRLGFDVSDIQIKRGHSGWFVERSEESVRHGEPRYWDGSAWSQDEGQTKLFRTKKSAEASVSSVPQLGFDITPAMREAVMAGVPLFSLVSDAAVLDNPSTPDVVRDVIAELVGVDALQLQEGVGRLVVTTSDQVAGQVKAAREAAFDAWFAGSKVVDQEGRPLVVYHGTFEKFSIFDMSKAGDGAHFFTTDKSHAESFGAADSYYISISDPMVITEDDLDAAWDEEHPEGEQDDRSLLPRDFVGLFVNKAKDAGKDGLIIRQMGDRDGQFDMYLPFGPEQIKSATNNRGTYDPRDPDITHSLAPARAQAFHDRQSGTTYFLADRIPAGKEASVFLHEVVHRHGRSRLPEGQFDALVGQVKAWEGHAQGSTERSIHDKAAGRVAAAGVSGPVADEELFAYAVEEAVAMGVQPSAMAHEGSAEAWLQAVVQSIQRVADKLIGNSLEQLVGQDLVDLAYALAQCERPELGAVVAQALQESLQGAVPAPHEDCLGFGR